MRIMPLTGNNIGFNIKAWRKLEDVVTKKAQTDDAAYWQSMQHLPLASAKTEGQSVNPYTDMVRSPGSPWGGKEVSRGNNYSATVVLSLSGPLTLPPTLASADDAATKSQIEQDFVEAWSENNACFQAVADARNELQGDKSEDDDVSVTVTSLLRKADGSVDVSIDLYVTIANYESDFDARQRASEERADVALDRHKEMDL
jgi:hypothetical protein